MGLSAAPASSCHVSYLPSNMASGIISSIKRKVLYANQPVQTANSSHPPQSHRHQERSVGIDQSMGNRGSRHTSNRSSARSNTKIVGAPAVYSQKSGDAPPPAYTAAPNAAAAPAANAVMDDPYDFLTSFDTVFLIDDSGSMAGRSWRETKDALETIIPVCVQHDSDGIDIHFLNARDSPYHHHVTSPATVREIFSSVQPRGSTPTGQRLSAILKPYLRDCERNVDAVKPLNLIVITDGVPTDDVESALIHAAKKLDKLDAPAWQIGVQFFQVGNDEGAKQHLKQLDDELSEIAGAELRDFVDTVPFKSSEGASLTGEGILKVVLGAVNRRLDRKKSKDLHG